MIRNNLKGKSTVKKTLLLSIVLLIIFLSIQFNSQTHILMVKATTEQEAFTAITNAFEDIQQASEEGMDVQVFVNRLNGALDDYYSENYEDAYDEAMAIIEDVNNELQIYERNQLFNYVLIPVNSFIVIAMILVFGLNILKWYKKQSKEEYLDLEIVYSNEDNLSELEE
ncbi:MAG: hypothetical protein FK734_02445 [Asgard group archaeon]|nr:hypothetical protein [Asgard group archaeon]